MCCMFLQCAHVLFSDELLAEKEKYKQISDELDQTFAELAVMWSDQRPSVRKEKENCTLHHIKMPCFADNIFETNNINFRTMLK